MRAVEGGTKAATSGRLAGKVCVVTGTGGSMALFLASDESTYVTGIDVVVESGMNVW